MFAVALLLPLPFLTQFNIQVLFAHFLRIKFWLMLHFQIFRQPPGKENKANRGRKELNKKECAKKIKNTKSKVQPRELCCKFAFATKRGQKKIKERRQQLRYWDGQTDISTGRQTEGHSQPLLSIKYQKNVRSIRTKFIHKTCRRLRRGKVKERERERDWQERVLRVNRT